MGNPFKGAEPYEEGDILYGRDREVKAILSFIRTEVLTFMFARSGTGKSSLIKASLIRELRENYYCPVYIHLSPKAAEGSTKASDLVEYIIELVRQEVAPLENKPGYAVHIPEKITGERDFYSLFDFMEGLKVTRVVPDGPDMVTMILKPVLIFDQFEEIFTLDYGQQKDSLNFLLSEINALIENRTPDYLVKNLLQPENAAKYQELKKSLISKQKNFRIVFSFREEYMPDFESLKNTIPDIGFTTGKFRLEAFSLETGAGVITSIAPDIGETTAGEIVRQLSVRASANFDRQTVDPFLLSLVCQKIYDRIAGAQQDGSAFALIQDLVANAINDHINSVYQRIGEQTKVFIEEKLITSDEKRTSFNLKDARQNKAIAPDIDLLLGAQGADGVKDYRCRLLNSEQLLDTLHVDILHDRLVPPLVRKRTERRHRNIRAHRRRIAWIAAACVLVAAGIVGYFINMQIQHYKRQSEEFTNLALLFKAGEFRDANNPLEAYAIYKNLFNTASGFAILQHQLKKVDLGTYDIPADGRAISAMKNNYVVAYTTDSVYRLWHIDSRDRVSVIKEYNDAAKILTAEDKSSIVAMGTDSLYTYDLLRGSGGAVPIDSTWDKDSPHFSPHQSYFTFYSDGRIHFVTLATGKQTTYAMDRYIYGMLTRVIDTTAGGVYCLYENTLARFERKNDSLVWDGKYKSLGTSEGQYIYLGGDSLVYLSNGNVWLCDLAHGTDELWYKGKFNEMYVPTDSILFCDYWKREGGSREAIVNENFTFYNLATHTLHEQYAGTHEAYGRFSVSTGYTRSLLTSPSGEVVLMDIRKSSFRPIHALRNALAYDITDDGKNVIYVLDAHDTARKDKTADSLLLYTYNIHADTSRLLDSICVDDEVADTTRIYSKYFFRTNATSNKIVYKKKPRDKTIVVVRDLRTGATLFESEDMDTFVDDVVDLDFTNDYIHLRDKNNDEGIVLLNGKPRNLDYYISLGWPLMADSVIDKVKKKYLMR